MPEYLEGGLEAGVEFECCYCWVAGTSTPLLEGLKLRQDGRMGREHGEGID